MRTAHCWATYAKYTKSLKAVLKKLYLTAILYCLPSAGRADSWSTVLWGACIPPAGARRGQSTTMHRISTCHRASGLDAILKKCVRTWTALPCDACQNGATAIDHEGSCSNSARAFLSTRTCYSGGTCSPRSLLSPYTTRTHSELLPPPRSSHVTAKLGCCSTSCEPLRVWSGPHRGLYLLKPYRKLVTHLRKTVTSLTIEPYAEIGNVVDWRRGQTSRCLLGPNEIMKYAWNMKWIHFLLYSPVLK